MGNISLSSIIGNDQFVDSVIATYKNQPIPKGLKKDYLEIIAFLNQKRVKSFYHFTDWRNLDSIKEHGGLYSWFTCQQKGIEIAFPGGNETSMRLDWLHNTEDFVKLSFCENHPMAYCVSRYRHGELVLLEIDPFVALLEDTVFTDCNSTDSNHKKGSHSDFLAKLDFEAIRAKYIYRDSPQFKPHQAEVMVKEFVSSRFILNLDDPYVLRF